MMLVCMQPHLACLIRRAGALRRHPRVPTAPALTKQAAGMVGTCDCRLYAEGSSPACGAETGLSAYPTPDTAAQQTQLPSLIGRTSQNLNAIQSWMLCHAIAPPQSLTCTRVLPRTLPYRDRVRTQPKRVAAPMMVVRMSMWMWAQTAMAGGGSKAQGTRTPLIWGLVSIVATFHRG